jgi:hypothetical protein
MLFDPENRGNTFVLTVGELIPDYMAAHSRRWYSFYDPVYSRLQLDVV